MSSPESKQNLLGTNTKGTSCNDGKNSTSLRLNTDGQSVITDTESKLKWILRPQK